LAEGYRTEINLESIDWIQHISTHLAKGYILTIDYGYTAREYYSADRKAGTLACFYQHTVSGELYHHIGEQDITAHVNFTALNIWGQKYGLDLTGYCNQNYFLRSLGLGSFLRELEINTPAENRNSLFQVNQLLMDMGHKFKVLIQQKGLDKKQLTGMQFSTGSL
jgi:SAM-dependent MidA family methyltransferase